MKVLSHVRIRCYVCKRPVVYAAKQDRPDLNAVEYHVRCHGCTDTCMVGNEFFEEMSNDTKIIEVTAFKPNRIGG